MMDERPAIGPTLMLRIRDKEIAKLGTIQCKYSERCRSVGEIAPPRRPKQMNHCEALALPLWGRPTYSKETEYCGL
jgi:hypothetical protein